MNIHLKKFMAKEYIKFRSVRFTPASLRRVISGSVLSAKPSLILRSGIFGSIGELKSYVKAEIRKKERQSQKRFAVMRLLPMLLLTARLSRKYAALISLPGLNI